MPGFPYKICISFSFSTLKRKYYCINVLYVYVKRKKQNLEVSMETPSLSHPMPMLQEDKSFFTRFRDTANVFDASSKRYVITNPPTDFNLIPSDQVCPRTQQQSSVGPIKVALCRAHFFKFLLLSVNFIYLFIYLFNLLVSTHSDYFKK